MLAGIGLQKLLDALSAWSPRARGHAVLVAGSVAALAFLELLVAHRHLPLNHPTAPESFNTLRTAPAHLLSAQARARAPGRFLSMSDTLFDPGDLVEIRQIYQDQLASPVLYDHIVNLKRQEILAPNLPLAWRIQAVDGYDGGVLPLARYVWLQRILLDESSILTDGRLREGLSTIPSSRLLSILGAEYVLTDKVHDVWIDGVFYDLSFEADLSSGADLGAPPIPPVQALSSTGASEHTATTLGILSHLQGTQLVAQGAPVASVIVTMRNPNDRDALEQHTFTMRAGLHTAQGIFQDAAHSQARVGREWQVEAALPGQRGYDYVARVSWETPRDVLGVEIRPLPFGGILTVRGLSLIDERDGSSNPLLLNAKGRFIQVHSGDVKIYQALDVLPRAYAVHDALTIASDNLAIEAMAEPSFDPAQTVLLHADGAFDGPVSTLPSPSTGTPPADSNVTVLVYEPHEIVLRAEMEQPGYVVLSDTWYPGWRATLDGRPTPIQRANLMFRALHVPQGSHNLHLTYRPESYVWGLGTSLGTLLIVILGGLLSIRPVVGVRAHTSPPTAPD
jgi:hypothetical protein